METSLAWKNKLPVDHQACVFIEDEVGIVPSDAELSMKSRGSVSVRK
jgi:hypothetical protein